MGTVIKNRGTSCVGVRKTGTTLIRVSTVMGTLYWKYYSWNCEGDVGGWSLVYVDEACVNHLILSNEWMMCDEHTYCGNIILEQEVLDRFKKK